MPEAKAGPNSHSWLLFLAPSPVIKDAIKSLAEACFPAKPKEAWRHETLMCLGMGRGAEQVGSREVTKQAISPYLPSGAALTQR